MSLVEILSHVSTNNLLVRLQQIEITLTLLRRDLERDVQELPEARVEQRMRLVVPQRAGKLIARPAVHFSRRR